MSNSYAKQILQDGPRNMTVNLAGILDTNDQPATVVISPSDCVIVPQGFRIDEIEYIISGDIQVQLWWEAIPDVLAVVVCGHNEVCYRDAGGLVNTGYRPTGAIKLKTSNYVSGTETYNLKIKLVKMGV